jgi:hypothetical protein
METGPDVGLTPRRGLDFSMALYYLVMLPFVDLRGEETT